MRVNIKEHVVRDGYQALTRVLTGMNLEDVVTEVKKSMEAWL